MGCGRPSKPRDGSPPILCRGAPRTTRSAPEPAKLNPAEEAFIHKIVSQGPSMQEMKQFSSKFQHEKAFRDGTHKKLQLYHSKKLVVRETNLRTIMELIGRFQEVSAEEVNSRTAQLSKLIQSAQANFEVGVTSAAICTGQINGHTRNFEFKALEQYEAAEVSTRYHTPASGTSPTERTKTGTHKDESRSPIGTPAAEEHRGRSPRVPIRPVPRSSRTTQSTDSRRREEALKDDREHPLRDKQPSSLDTQHLIDALPAFQAAYLEFIDQIVTRGPTDAEIRTFYHNIKDIELFRDAVDLRLIYYNEEGLLRAEKNLETILDFLHDIGHLVDTRELDDRVKSLSEVVKSAEANYGDPIDTLMLKFMMPPGFPIWPKFKILEPRLPPAGRRQHGRQQQARPRENPRPEIRPHGGSESSWSSVLDLDHLPPVN